MSSTKRIALDTTVLVQNAVRRMLAGVQEYAGGEVFLPEEAVREAGKVYARVIGAGTLREVQWTIGKTGPHTREEMVEEAVRRTRRRTEGFRRWLGSEPLRNDGIYIRESIREGTERLAEEISVQIDGGRTAGEKPNGDPLVIAQALEAGAELVTTWNMERLVGEDLDEVIERGKAKGRWPDAAMPFVRTADQAVRTRLTGATREERDAEICRIIHALTRPADPVKRTAQRLKVAMARYAAALERSGMTEAGGALERATTKRAGRVDEWIEQMEEEPLRLKATRQGEARRLQVEREGVGKEQATEQRQQQRKNWSHQGATDLNIIGSSRES